MKKNSVKQHQSPEAAPKGPAMSCDMLSLPPTHCCTIIENIAEGVLTIDLEKTITYFNPAAEAITGFSPTEAIGQKCFDIFRADICEKDCPFDRNLASGSPVLHPRATLIDKSGREVRVNTSTSLIKDEAGCIVGGVRIFSDLSEIEALRRSLNRSFTHEDIVGRHPRMKEILSFLPDIAESESAVLIEGPTGSGKELIARAIHHLSPRKEGPFIAVNCAALPETLLESELFGYNKGAFTGAAKNKPGRFSLADKGTLFLDEISSTSPSFQADLLRILEGGEFTPLGDTRTLKSDFRLVTATNLELHKRVQDAKFREDLYYRLNVVKISVPPLRDRKEDIPLLIDHFIRKFNLLKGRSIEGVTPEVIAFLLEHPFPGNIRELENIVEYAFITCKGARIGMEHLSRDLVKGQKDQGRLLSADEEEEAGKIRTILKECRQNRSKAARVLGMSRSTLWRKMKKYSLLR
ncbi:MAG: sigma-54 interaction domain-containing protein [Thermodesulfobacteriota bacterium]